MPTQPHPIRGILAGIAGGLFASWVMNQFTAKAGTPLTAAAKAARETYDEQTGHPTPPAPPQDDTPQPDATMKTADAITAAVTGGQHLTWEQEEQAGPIVHYAFGALAGGIYGALAEYSPTARAGSGTAFGTVLFATADLAAVPAFHLSAPLTDYPAESYLTPFAAHLVYGLTTELTRRLIRKIL
jgi:uncharacterized membrane protein YagU involved in acid resistance